MNITRIQERLLMNVAKNSGTDCWNWSGQVSNSGYGRIKIKDEHGDIRMQSAEHVSYEAFVGPVPRDRLIKQSCNNRLCRTQVLAFYRKPHRSGSLKRSKTVL